MSSDSNQENNHQDNVSTEKIKDNNEKKSLTFKDWKSLKDNKYNNEISQKNRNGCRPKSINTICNGGSDYRNSYSNYNNSGNGSRILNGQGDWNFLARYNAPCGSTITNHFNAVNNYNSNFGMCSDRLRRGNSGFNTFDAPNNSFNTPTNFGDTFKNNRFNNSIGLNNFTNSNVQNSFGHRRNCVNGLNEGNNVKLPESFFSSDGIFRQRNFMQKPLSNPFRNEEKADRLIQEFDKSRYTKEDKKKKKGNKKSAEAIANSSADNMQPNPRDIRNVSNEPKVYVPNPKAKIDGKPYIPKPKIPEQNLEITKEEKKQQWKEYRQAMKPFKNRDFYNAKRVVQRLGKKPPSELDEKQLIRLTNARTIMEAHKERLSAKYANYIKADDSSNELGELYVLKKKSLNDSDFEKTKQYQNYGNFGDSRPLNNFESGRKIVDNCTNFRGFVTGGILNGTIQKLDSQK